MLGATSDLCGVQPGVEIEIWGKTGEAAYRTLVRTLGTVGAFRCNIAPLAPQF